MIPHESAQLAVAANSTEQLRAGERETVKERETREEAAGCGLIYKKKKLKTRLLVIHKRATYMICQPAHMRRERAPFFIAYSNETEQRHGRCRSNTDC